MKLYNKWSHEEGSQSHHAYLKKDILQDYKNNLKLIYKI